jgi:(1->4)-alpha-D-glucan 1-alpha-D-glucosylmutase
MYSGMAKMYVTWQGLEARKANPGLFTQGQYIPLEVMGGEGAPLFAFARKLGGRIAVVIIPRLVTADRKGGRVRLPDMLPEVPLRDAFTGKLVQPRHGSEMNVSDVLADFPVALLLSGR